MINVMPFLLFDGNCAEAMKFYQSCLGGDLTITKAADTPMREQVPPEHHQKVVNAHLKNHAVELTASDWLHPARTPKQGRFFEPSSPTVLLPASPGLTGSSGTPRRKMTRAT